MLFSIILGARSALLNIDEPSNVVWTVDQKFLSNGSKHCVQLNILYFSLISMVEIFSEMWHDVRVHIYFQEIDNDDDVNEDLYNAAFNSLQPYNYDSNNDNNNIGYQNKRKNTNEFNYKDHLKYEYESKDENNDGIKHSDENKEKDKTNWLKGRLIIKFGSSGEKVLGEEERSLSQGLASLHTLHRVLIDAGGGCAAQHGAQYKALGSGTPFNGARDKDRDGDGTITGALNSVNFNKRNNDNKNSSKTNKYGGAYDGGMTCWIPCGILLTDSYEEHSPEHQEPSPSKRRDILMDLFVDPSERKHSIHKQKLFILDFDKKNQEKKLKKEKNNTHEEKNQNNDKIRKRSWINIPEFIARLSNTNKNKNDNEINDKNKNKNGNELKEMNVEVTANKWEFRNDQLKELKELKIPKSPSSSPSQSSAGCLSGLNLIYSKDNLNIAGYIRDKKWILNDNCALDRDTLEWPAPHGRMRRGTGSNNESYAILDTGRPYWKSSPIFSHSSSTTPPSSPIPLSPYSEIPLSPYSHSHSHTHIASHSAFSNSPPLSPSLSPSRSSSLISSPRHFASTPFPPPFSPQPSPPKNSPKIQQELYGPQYWPSNVDNVNGKKDSRTSANTEKKKLRASLNALSSAAMLSSLVDEDLKEYNHTTFTFEIKSNRNKNKRPSRRSSFSAVLNRLSNSFRFPTKSPSVSI